MAKNAKSGATKSSLIRALLEKGVDSPTEVARRIQAEHGTKIDPTYVSVIKSQLRSRAAKAAKGASGGRAPDPERAAMLFVLRSGGSLDAAKKSLEELKASPALAFAVSMGGVERALRVLGELEKALRK